MFPKCFFLFLERLRSICNSPLSPVDICIQRGRRTPAGCIRIIRGPLRASRKLEPRRILGRAEEFRKVVAVSNSLIEAPRGNFLRLSAPRNCCIFILQAPRSRR